MRRAVKVLLWAVFGPLLALLAVGAAWVASNGLWADAAPQPVPPALLPPPVTLAPEANAFFDTQGLRAPDGEDVNLWGQRAWRDGADPAAPLARMPSGKDWQCHAEAADCLTRWRAASAALAAQMADARTFGARCKALAARTDFHETLPPPRSPAADGSAGGAFPMAQFAPITTCVRWFQVEAVLAPDVTRAHAAWAQADALLRLLASGTQTLFGQAVTWTSASRHQLLLAQWAAQQAPGHALPEALLAPLPARLLQPRTWMAAESHWQREVLPELQHWDTDLNAVQAWIARHSIGTLPELTRQSINARWAAAMQSHGDLQGAALASRKQADAEAPEPSLWQQLPWRNTLGEVLQHVAQQGYRGYGLRQADVVLYQAALGLSQRLNALPAAERAGGWTREPLDPGLRERMSLAGDALLIRPWHAQAKPERERTVRFPLRPV